jgi:hypothetical protein
MGAETQGMKLRSIAVACNAGRTVIARGRLLAIASIIRQ